MTEICSKLFFIHLSWHKIPNRTFHFSSADRYLGKCKHILLDHITTYGLGLHSDCYFVHIYELSAKLIGLKRNCIGTWAFVIPNVYADRLVDAILPCMRHLYLVYVNTMLHQILYIYQRKLTIFVVEHRNTTKITYHYRR